MDSSSLPLARTLALIALCLLCCFGHALGAGPSAGQLRVRLAPALDGVTQLCVLDGSGLGLTSLAASDITPFAAVTCGRSATDYIQVVDFSHNALGVSLYSLSTGVFSTLVNAAQDKAGLQLDLSFNQFTSATISAVSLSDSLAACPLCSTSLNALDIGFNDIGPAFPTAVFRTTLSQTQPIALSMISCGITDVPALVLSGARVSSINLALNDLSSGLHLSSFAGLVSVPSLDIFLAYTNLRTASLPSGVFAITAPASGSSYTARLNLANEVLLPDELSNTMYVPRTYVNDSRLFTKDRFTSPTATAYVHRLPTTTEYLASWSNCFVAFPSSVLTLATATVKNTYVQPIWTTIALGDVISFTTDNFLSGLFLDASAAVHNLSVTVDLAPQVAFDAVGASATSASASTAFCPFESLCTSLFQPWGALSYSPNIKFLKIRGYDLPLASSSCSLPACDSCSTVFSTVGAIQLPTEPTVLRRAVNLWLTAVGFAAASRTLAYAPPRFALWSPQLNQSSWIDASLLCDLSIGAVVMPGLPWSEDPAQANFPFAPPTGLLSCLTSPLLRIDWSAQKLFNRFSLASIPSTINLVISLDMQHLYRGVTPLPYGMFDITTGSIVKAATACSTSNTTGACARMVSTCPSWSNLTCTVCGAGFFAAIRNTYAYCSACPIGFYCDPPLGVLTPTACPEGSYNGLTAQSTCSLCPAGSYSTQTAQTEASACTQCPAGRANPTEGGISLASCKPCSPGSSSAVPGAGECVSCTPGQYQPDSGKFQCLVCGVNTYNSNYGSANATSCTACPALTPQSVAGSTSLLACTAFNQWCPAGNYSRSGDLVPCTMLCPLGSACVDGIVTECLAGSFTSELGSSSCTPCGAGNYGYINGSTSQADCFQCQLSAYSAAEIASTCTLCVPGTASSALGSTSITSCVAVPNCVTAATLLLEDAVDRILDTSTNTPLCVLGGTTPIQATRLFTLGIISLHTFLLMAVELATRLALTTADPLAAGVDALGFWVPLKYTPSLRLAAFGSDAILTTYGATQAAKSNTSLSATSDPTKAAISDTTAYVLFSVFLVIAFLPWLVYRFVPAKVALYADQFKLQHRVPIGVSQRNSPTQLGAIMTWSFMWVAILVVVLLGTESNTTSTTELVPPSSTEFSGTARANFQITMRAYTGDSPEVMAKWCNSTLLTGQNGLTNSFTIRTISAKISGESCDIAANCIDCGMSASAYVSFVLPYNAQLTEWELWVNSAQAGSWARAYGVHTAPATILLPALTTMDFTAIESYFVDARTAASIAPTSPMSSLKPNSGVASSSGFEFNFVGLNFVTSQPIATFNAHSTVGVAFSFSKSDIILRTQLTNKQTVLQILAVVASAVVSLFSLFGIAFQLLEAHIWRRCGWPTGQVVRVDSGEIELQDIPGSPKGGPQQSQPDETGFDNIELSVNPVAHSPHHHHDQGPVLRQVAGRSDDQEVAL